MDTLWVSLMTYNFKWRDNAWTIEEENFDANQRCKPRADGLVLDVDFYNSIADLEMQTLTLIIHEEGHKGSQEFEYAEPEWRGAKKQKSSLVTSIHCPQILSHVLS